MEVRDNNFLLNTILYIFGNLVFLEPGRVLPAKDSDHQGASQDDPQANTGLPDCLLAGGCVRSVRGGGEEERDEDEFEEPAVLSLLGHEESPQHPRQPSYSDWRDGLEGGIRWSRWGSGF